MRLLVVDGVTRQLWVTVWLPLSIIMSQHIIAYGVMRYSLIN